jgi:hypothetical protein
MHQDLRDLMHTGIYICAVGALTGGLFVGVSSTYQSVASTVEADIAIAQQEPTRIALAVQNAREIREALATPIPRPEPLPSITAKAANAVPRIVVDVRSKLPRAVLDAMLMDTGRTSTSAPPELHGVH